MARKLPTFLTRHERGQLLALNLSPRDRAIVTVFLLAGLRANELRMLDITDVDFDAGTIHIRHAKRDKERMVPLHQAAGEALKEYLAGRLEGPIFLSNRGRRMSYDRLHSLTIELGKQAGIRKRTRPHVFRHTFAVGLHESGTDLAIIQELLGHEDIRTTTIYLHCSMAAKRQAVDRL